MIALRATRQTDPAATARRKPSAGPRTGGSGDAAHNASAERPRMTTMDHSTSAQSARCTSPPQRTGRSPWSPRAQIDTHDHAQQAPARAASRPLCASALPHPLACGRRRDQHPAWPTETLLRLRPLRHSKPTADRRSTLGTSPRRTSKSSTTDKSRTSGRLRRFGAARKSQQPGRMPWSFGVGGGT